MDKITSNNTIDVQLFYGDIVLPSFSEGRQDVKRIELIARKKYKKRTKVMILSRT